MIRLRSWNFWTVLVVSGLAFFTIARALPVARFGWNEALVDAQNADARLRLFVDAPAIGGMARRDLWQIVPSTDPAQASEDLGALLGRAPIAGREWVDLARARLVTGARLEQVASALAVSVVTAPNESQVMAARASFGLPLWASLPPDSRRGLVGDLLGGWGDLAQNDRDSLRAIFAAGPVRSRQEVLGALLLSGKAGAPIIAALGLVVEPPPGTDGPAGASQSAPGRSIVVPEGALSPVPGGFLPRGSQ